MCATILKKYAIHIIIIVILLGIWGILIYMATRKHNDLEKQKQQQQQQLVPYNNFDNNHQAIENFAAISDTDYNKFKDAAKTIDGLTEDKKQEILGILGCQNAINQNMQGYRSAESGATFKIEEVKDITTNNNKYIIHTANDLVLSADNISGRLSRVVKNTKDTTQLFDRENVLDGGKPNGLVMFTKILSTGIKFGIQYEHESLSLRPLNMTINPQNPTPYGRGQQFIYDINLKGELLDNAAMALGYRLLPAVGSSEIQNAGGVAVYNNTSSDASPPVATTKSNQSLLALTEKQFSDAITAALGNITAFNKSTGVAQPGTLNNPFANKPIRFNVNLSGLNGDSDASSSSSSSALKNTLSGFTNIPSSICESFTTTALSSSGTGQVRNLIQAWDSTINPSTDNDIGGDISGFPKNAGTLDQSLRGKMVSCPKIDRTQYYTERQLSQCAGCTPDAYLRGQLGGNIYS